MVIDFHALGIARVSLHGLPFDWSTLFARQIVHHSAIVARHWCDLNFSTLCIMLE